MIASEAGMHGPVLSLWDSQQPAVAHIPSEALVQNVDAWWLRVTPTHGVQLRGNAEFLILVYASSIVLLDGESEETNTKRRHIIDME